MSRATNEDHLAVLEMLSDGRLINGQTSETNNMGAFLPLLCQTLD